MQNLHVNAALSCVMRFSPLYTVPRNGAAHMGGNTSGMVWSIKSITDCFKNSRQVIRQVCPCPFLTFDLRIGHRFC